MRRVILYVFLVLCAAASVAMGQPVDPTYLDPGAVGDKLEQLSWFASMPLWAKALIPFVVSGFSAVLSALVKDGKLGALAPIVNALGANSWGNAKGSQ